MSSKNRTPEKVNFQVTHQMLYYGAVHDDQSGLHAHVWVCDGDVDVIGGEMADRFAVLATFPPQNPEMVT
jgi:hypothetical protein